MRKIVHPILPFLMVLTLCGGIIACQSGPDENTVQAYADPVTETTLQGLSENNLAKYTQYGNAEFKAALTPELFGQAAALVNSQLGAYESKEFLTIEEQEGYTIVHYRAIYAKGEVGIRMVFDEDHLIAGQWFE